MSELDLDSVLADLTLEEKASLVIGADFWRTAAVPRLGVESVKVSDGPHGLRTQGDEGDHVGLLDSLPATCFPTAAGLASCWDPTVVAAVGAALAQEARSLGVAVILGPGVNVKRSALCGRNFEYFSEDPFLAGVLATALVESIQEHGVGTSLKHYAANNQETDRLRVSAEVDERTLREIYLPAFERVVRQAAPWTVMCAYNKVNGVYASEHHWLLTEVLREEWGFDGLVVSDWGAVHDRVASLAAGLDLEMPPALGRSDVAVIEAVRSGTLAPALLDLAARRVLQLVQRARPGGLDRPAAPAFDEHHALARTVAAASAVLLKNEGEVLPLAAGTARIAVVGEFARTPRFQGAGSSQVNVARCDVGLEALVAALPQTEITFGAGFGIEGTEDDDSLLREAVGLAGDADVVVCFLGLPAAAESEGFDRTDIDLPANQLALLDAVTAVHDRVVVVLANGSAVRLSTWEPKVAAVLECWLGGQAAGGAVADLLTGAVNPSGKLAETFARRIEDNPATINFPGDSQVVRYGEGLFVGYRGYDALALEVSHPFGFGLSYTTFELGTPTLTVAGSVRSGDLDVVVTVPVTNTGSRAGAEVVQGYVRDVESSVVRPVRELKAFARIELAPGERGEVVLRLDERSFAYWSTLHRRWAVEAGAFEIAVGTSSRDLLHVLGLDLDAPSVAAPIDADSTLQEWLADPRGSALLHQAAASDSPLDDPVMIKVIGTMPMATLANFGLGGLDHDVLEQLTAALRSS